MTSFPSAGTELPEYQVGDITPDRLVAVMEVMGDTNPIHDDEDLARSLGLRGLVNQGPANLAYVVNMLMAGLGAAPSQIRVLDFRFQANVVPGDILTARGTVTAVRPVDRGAEIDCSFRLDKLDDSPRLVGTAVVFVPSGGSEE